MDSQDLPQLRRPSSRRKHRAMLTAAGTVFLQMGYAAASIDDIAAAAGVAKATVYAHFGSKRDLFVAVVEDRTQAAGSRVEATFDALPLDAPVQERLRSVALSLLESVLLPDLVALRRLVIAEQPHHPELADAFWRGGAQRVISRMQKFADDLVAAGELAIDDTHAFATAANWLILGEPLNEMMFRGTVATPDETQRLRIAERAARILVDAHAAR